MYEIGKKQNNERKKNPLWFSRARATTWILCMQI